MVAAGKGERMGAPVPKVFLPLAGVPVLIRTLQSLLHSPCIATVVIVIAPEREALCRQVLQTYAPFARPIRTVHGGAERQDSVRLGLAALDEECEIVVIHDAARPLVTPRLIEQSITVAAEHGGALVAVPVRDTVKRVAENGRVLETVSRHQLWLAQTPQTFRVPLIRAAHARAFAAGVRATDDAALVEWMGESVRVVPGDPLNVKLTTPDDWSFAEAVLKKTEQGESGT
ncbi:MAG: 2-C-methyl-D-erythritol 4-phosphate cytidylyltransferase [Candidatus Binatia bacterium]|nr:2-C-methyl-D-erythritol 4-phosphate cytidylyltransferase [Candidatus Binatia bacterium]